MNRKTHASLALMAMLLSGPAIARTYSVKKGDTLSHIAVREFGRPIYGPKGSLQKLLNKNPELKNPDSIRPDQIIRLSDDEIAPQDTSAAAPASPAVEAPLPPPSEAAENPVAAEAAPSPDSNQETGQSRSSRFGLKLGLGLSKDEMEAVDHEREFKTVLDSELQSAIDLDAYYKPSESSRLGASIGVKKTAYDDTNDGRFEGRSRSLNKLSLFGDITFFDRLHLGLEFGTEQSIFFKQTSNTNFTIEEVFADFASLSLGYDILVQNSWRWALLAEGRFHAASDAEGYDVEKGSSYRIATRLAYQLNASYSLEGTIHYGRRNQGIDGVRQTTTERAAEIALRYEL